MFSRSCRGLAVLATLFTLIVSTTGRAADWPQWRGPNRDGVSKETGLLQEWPAGGPKLLWQVKDLGRGYSTPSVVGGRIYILANKGLQDELVRVLDVKDGKEVWSTRIGKVGNPEQQPNFPAARSTPTVDGERVFALGSDGDLVCLSTDTGKIIWQKNLRSDFGGKPGTWAYAESPLIDGDVLVCTPGGEQATLVALNKNSGTLIWKCAVPGGDAAGYASIIPVQAAGVKQYVAYPEKGLVGVDARTGKFLWRYEKTKGIANMPTPVARENLVYSGANRTGGGLVRLIADADSVKAEQVYFDPKLPTAIGGWVVVGDYLYGSGGQVLLCADFKTGQVKWTDRSAAPGSLCFADGRLYLHGENGEVVLIEATSDGYRERGRFAPPDQPTHKQMEKAWAYPVVSGGQLYIRDLDSLWCYDIKAPTAAR